VEGLTVTDDERFPPPTQGLDPAHHFLEVDENGFAFHDDIQLIRDRHTAEVEIDRALRKVRILFPDDFEPANNVERIAKLHGDLLYERTEEAYAARQRRWYAEAAERLLSAGMVAAALEKHPRTPEIYLRHKNHWTGWSLSFREPNEGDGDAAPLLLWRLKHTAGRVVIDAEASVKKITVNDDTKGHVIWAKERPYYAILNLICDCRQKYFQNLHVTYLMRQCAESMDSNTPHIENGRIFIRPRVD
jgi:hypothetical protein